MAISSPSTHAAGVKAPSILTVSADGERISLTSSAHVAFADMNAALAAAVAAEALLDNPQSSVLPHVRLASNAEAAVNAAMGAARKAARANVRVKNDTVLVLWAKMIDFSLGIENAPDRTACLDCLTDAAHCWSTQGHEPGLGKTRAMILQACNHVVVLSGLLYPGTNASADIATEEFVCAA